MIDYRASVRVRLICVAVGIWAGNGCGARSPEPIDLPVSWAVVAVGSAPGANHLARSGDAIPPVSVILSGPPGFLRATLAVERGQAEAATKQALYDVLFPVRGSVRFEASVQSPPDPTGQARVQFRQDSDADASVAFVEPDVPFLAQPVAVATEPILGAGRSIKEGEETAVGRWVVRTGGEVTTTTVRVLLSRRPTAPRLKLESQPPL